MRKLPFKSSQVLSLGVELELQIIDPATYGLIPRAKDLIRIIRESPFRDQIKPEITQSMIEINSSIHQTPSEMYADLIQARDYLLQLSVQLGVKFSGGGTHPFQKWALQKIFPSQRFKHIYRRFRYLSKCSTVFGQHIHIGCANADDALYLTHALARYVPQFIAITANSPFYQGEDTGFYSSRSNVFSSFPLSGIIPYLITWREFSDYFYKMRNLGIVKTMKDFYWDVRPKPEFGTVEIRVCDTPLTIEKAIDITAYIQTLSSYLLKNKPIKISNDLYYIYNYNRFQASRFGLDGSFINPMTLQQDSIGNDILETIEILKIYADDLNNSKYLEKIKTKIINKDDDANFLRQVEKQTNSLSQVVHAQCLLWEKN